MGVIILGYGGGFALFVLRVPERFLPGAFDIFGHSHQLWHVGVAVAGFGWLEGMLDHATWRLSLGSFCSVGA